MIARLVGLAADARRATRGVADPRDLAAAARWIAANALATRGLEVRFEGAVPRAPRVFGLRARCFASAIAAIASLPVLIDAEMLPRHWRMALRALGLPALDRATASALAGGACVLSPDGLGSAELSVDPDPRGFRVMLHA